MGTFKVSCSLAKARNEVSLQATLNAFQYQHKSGFYLKHSSSTFFTFHRTVLNVSYFSCKKLKDVIFYSPLAEVVPLRDALTDTGTISTYFHQRVGQEWTFKQH